MSMKIEFRAFDEFPKYEVGDDGSIWSLDYNHTGKRKELRQWLDRDGYSYVILVVNSKRFKRLVHRMVATCFIPNINNKPQVNHKNGVRNDNRVENLEWCTASENALHGFRVNGRKVTKIQRDGAKERFSGTKNPKAKVNEAVALSIRRLRSKGDTLKSIAERHGLSKSQVSAIANNKFWKQ